MNEFYKRFQDFAKINPGMLVAVYRNCEPQNAIREKKIRLAWFTYLTERGHTKALQSMLAIWSGGGKALTFPCERPEIFDPSYVTPMHGYRDPSSPECDERGNIASGFVTQLLGELKSADARMRPRQKKPQPDPVSPLDVLNGYLENPPPLPVLSDEARRLFSSRETSGAAG